FRLPDRRTRRAPRPTREAGPKVDPEPSYLYELLRNPSGVSYRSCFTLASAQSELFGAYPTEVSTQKRDRPMNNATILVVDDDPQIRRDRKSTRLNSSHQIISYAVFCL